MPPQTPIGSPSLAKAVTPNLALNKNAYAYQQPVFYATPASSPPSSQPQPQPQPQSQTTSPQEATSTIPYHPHPPLKRWPNDYTVSELTAGFLAMEALIAQAPPGANMTQRTAFERVFGSRYVKSTVCRHRGVWKKSKGPLREQFEAMGTDERACWGEFIRRIEGRPPAKSVNLSHGVPGPLPVPGIMLYPGHLGTATVGQGQMLIMHGGDIQNQTMPGEDGGRVEEEPVMGSLQKPDGEGVYLGKPLACVDLTVLIDENPLQNGQL
jgi:hypothetical protein